MTSTGTRPEPRSLSAGRVRILLFATARTAVGSRSLHWPVPLNGVSVQELVADLGEAHPKVAPILRHSRFFHDGVPVARLDERVLPGEELAVHPPYGGG